MLLLQKGSKSKCAGMKESQWGLQNSQVLSNLEVMFVIS